MQEMIGNDFTKSMPLSQLELNNMIDYSYVVSYMINGY